MLLSTIVTGTYCLMVVWIIVKIHLACFFYSDWCLEPIVFISTMAKYVSFWCSKYALNEDDQLQ